MPMQGRMFELAKKSLPKEPSYPKVYVGKQQTMSVLGSRAVVKKINFLLAMNLSSYDALVIETPRNPHISCFFTLPFFGITLH